MCIIVESKILLMLLNSPQFSQILLTNTKTQHQCFHVYPVWRPFFTVFVMRNRVLCGKKAKKERTGVASHLA